MRVLLGAWALVLGLGAGLAAEPAEVPTVGGLVLPAEWDLPEGSARAVVVMVHGSGAHSRDEELAVVTEGKASNPFFARLGGALRRRNVACLRYDKRNYALQQKGLGADEELRENPAEALIGDCLRAVAVARQRFPQLPVILLGHSEGTWVALQAARRDPSLAGVALVSYSQAPLASLVLEQTVYRPLGLFERLDQNRDGQLSSSEMTDSLRQQMGLIDLDRSGTLSRSEFQAGNWSNVVARSLIPDAWRRNEGALPDANQLVRESPQRLLFLQGDWDNQTPSYGVKALEILEKASWKKGNKRFCYFARAGHALDLRKSYDDLTYTVTPESTLEDCARYLESFLVNGESADCDLPAGKPSERKTAPPPDDK